MCKKKKKKENVTDRGWGEKVRLGPEQNKKKATEKDFEPRTRIPKVTKVGVQNGSKTRTVSVNKKGKKEFHPIWRGKKRKKKFSAGGNRGEGDAAGCRFPGTLEKKTKMSKQPVKLPND